MSATPSRKREGKYLTFALGNEEYGIDALKVQGILGMQQITPMPQAPHYVKGVTTVRGKVAPIISARLKLGMSEIEYTSETCIILVSLRTSWAGLIVDTVRDVIDIWENQIEDAPKTAGSYGDQEEVIGLAKIGKTVKILLDIEKTLSDVMPDEDNAAANAFPLDGE
ncbi:MAG: chemotaxis protein CheW [Planctomycetes bacterium]|nr:chemotaxis protein CheW [Planctomycetota bacterium]MCC8115940.1 chemotaxis protein CheW [Planctomycetota bacterium]